MAGSNGYANMVRNRKPRGKRRKLDDYETPGEVTSALCRAVQFKGPILEPAAGSGRMARALRAETGRRVVTADLKRGVDFLKRTKHWPGDIVTNPPYGAGRADAFVRHALKLARGKVAMLLELKYPTGEKRVTELFSGHLKPEAMVWIPWRIQFIVNGKPIKSQFYNHCWVVWPEKRLRNVSHDCKTYWAEDERKIFDGIFSR